MSENVQICERNAHNAYVRSDFMMQQGIAGIVIKRNYGAIVISLGEVLVL